MGGKAIAAAPADLISSPVICRFHSSVVVSRSPDTSHRRWGTRGMKKEYGTNKSMAVLSPV